MIQMATKYYMSYFGRESSTLNGIRKEAVRILKDQDRSSITIKSHNATLGNDAWRTEKIVGYAKRSGNTFLWVSPKNNILGYIDDNGAVVKSKGLKFDRYYDLGIKIRPTGHFMGDTRKFKTVVDARKAAYATIIKEFNTRGYPNYGPTTSVMIVGHHIRANKGYSNEEFVYPDGKWICVAKLPDNLTGQCKVYRLMKGGNLGEYIGVRTLKQIHKLLWNVDF